MHQLPRLELLLRHLVVALALIAPGWAQFGPCTIETVAGGRVFSESGGPAVAAELYSPDSARLAPDGSLYITDTLNNVIRRVSLDGTISTVAGTGEAGFSGDGGPATQALLTRPSRMAFGPDGSYYFIDSNGVRIRRVSPEDIISTVVGNGISWASRITLDAEGNMYIAGGISHRVWKVTPDGILHHLAGNSDPVRPRGAYSGDGGPAVDAALDNPVDVAVDSAGNVYIADLNNNRIRRVNPEGVIETFLGLKLFGSTEDGTLRTEAGLSSPAEIEIDGEDRFYWTHQGNVRYLDEEDRLGTVYGPALFVSFFSVSPSGVMHSLRNGQVFRLVLPTGMELVAGIGPTAAFGDGGPATEALIGEPQGLAAGPNGEIYVLDSAFSLVRRFTPGGVIERFAGTGEQGNTGDGGPATEATFFHMRDIAVDSLGNLYISDSSHRVRRVDQQGMISVFAGTGSISCTERINACDEGELAIEADLPFPSGLEVDSEDNVYIQHGRITQGLVPVRSTWIRRVNGQGIINRISDAGITEDPQQSTAAAFAITLDDRILVSLNGFPTPPYYQANLGQDFVPIPGSQGFTSIATTFAGDSEGNVYFSDRGNAITRLTPDGVLNTIAGGLNAELTGEGVPAAEARVSSASGFLLLDGHLYFGDRGSSRVRRVNDVGACPVIVRPQMSTSGATHGASFQAGLAPGTIFTVFGIRLGPDEGVGAQIGPDGRLTEELGGTRVLIDGISAPMVFSSSTQLNGIAPYGIEFGGGFDVNGFFEPDRSITVQVEHDGVLSEVTRFTPYPYLPALFTLDGSGTGQTAALNQDGTVNGPLNPAPVGTVIVLFATGEGQTDPPGVDGKIAVEPLPKPLVGVEVLIDREPAQVLYAGAAPGLTAGVMQVNAVIPPDLEKRGPVSVQLVMGAFQSTRFGPVIIVGE